ncbi:hypothetical protein [Collinsella tanakaei]|nr:hypothetical protein [Collinsella tanakaei]MDM8301093.1 hypothetical protein [Collinsella tanakaei]
MLTAMVVGKPAIVGNTPYGDLAEVEVDEQQAVVANNRTPVIFL